MLQSEEFSRKSYSSNKQVKSVILLLSIQCELFFLSLPLDVPNREFDNPSFRPECRFKSDLPVGSRKTRSGLYYIHQGIVQHISHVHQAHSHHEHPPTHPVGIYTRPFEAPAPSPSSLPSPSSSTSALRVRGAGEKRTRHKIEQVRTFSSCSSSLWPFEMISVSMWQYIASICIIPKSECGVGKRLISSLQCHPQIDPIRRGWLSIT